MTNIFSELKKRQLYNRTVREISKMPNDVALDLDHIAYRVPAGHRISVAISSAYWPLIWPSPESVALTLSSGRIDVPIRPSVDHDEWVFAPPDADAPWETKTLREERHVRRSETDHTTGEVHLIIEDDFGKVEDADHGLVAGSIARERWTIHPDDPLSARGILHWSDEMERGDLKIRTETFSEMWSDKAKFFLRARLVAYEGDRLVYDRDIVDEVPRDQI